MDNIFLLTLQITLVGMGLVFGAILLLWGLMAVLVRLAPEKDEQSIARFSPTEASPPGVGAQAEISTGEMRHRAAAAAVTIALAQELDHTPHAFPTPPTAAVSAWQAISRANAMNKRGRNR